MFGLQTFLVRNSRQVGNFAVSVCLPPGMEVDIQHYLITRDDAGSGVVS